MHTEETSVNVKIQDLIDLGNAIYDHDHPVVLWIDDLDTMRKDAYGRKETAFNRIVEIVSKYVDCVSYRKA
jgi:hypothetical protein